MDLLTYMIYKKYKNTSVGIGNKLFVIDRFQNYCSDRCELSCEQYDSVSKQFTEIVQKEKLFKFNNYSIKSVVLGHKTFTLPSIDRDGLNVYDATAKCWYKKTYSGLDDFQYRFTCSKLLML